MNNPVFFVLYHISEVLIHDNDSALRFYHRHRIEIQNCCSMLVLTILLGRKDSTFSHG